MRARDQIKDFTVLLVVIILCLGTLPMRLDFLVQAARDRRNRASERGSEPQTKAAVERIAARSQRME
jgi:hypothetical protein